MKRQCKHDAPTFAYSNTPTLCALCMPLTPNSLDYAARSPLVRAHRIRTFTFLLQVFIEYQDTLLILRRSFKASIVLVLSFSWHSPLLTVLFNICIVPG